MDRESLRDRIKHNMRSAGLRIENIRIQPDPYAGWRVVVVSPDYSGVDAQERQRLTLQGIDPSDLQWGELIASDEADLAGVMPLDGDLEDLPMWPESLARGQQAGEVRPVVFPSDLDEDLPLPIVVTFYSMRGGVGRSTALAYCGQVLAAHGHSVLCIDMDLEAPGLAALFGQEQSLRPNQGLVSLLLDLDQGEHPDILSHVLKLSESRELYLLPAGFPDADYARKLRLLDPEAWYREERNPLRSLLAEVEKLPFRPEAILIDARTGITPMSAPLLFDLPDVAVIAFFPHPQARLGTGALVRALLTAKSRRRERESPLTPEPRFLISPVPAGRGTELQRYKNRALEWISDWLSACPAKRDAIDVEDVTHVVPYSELISTSDQILNDGEAARRYEPVAEWVETFIPTRAEKRAASRIASIKDDILSQLSFSAGAAEQQENFSETFVMTDLFQQAIDFGKVLILGRKGTGKTAIFRWLLENRPDRAFPIMAPPAFRMGRPWLLSPDGLRVIDTALDSSGSTWREFWLLHTATAMFLAARQRGQDVPLPDGSMGEGLAPLIQAQLTERRVVDFLSRHLRRPDTGLLASDWLQQMDQRLPEDSYLLCDGLDVGFGNGPADRERRSRTVEGLLSFLLDRQPSLMRLHFKIVLREDIWRRLSFENMSHLFGLSVRLQWKDKADYLRTALKQALRSMAFENVIAGQVRGGSVDAWSEEEVFRTWSVLVGERMKGAQTTFTRNWVWNRLADGNLDHGPRALLQLLREAVEWERTERQRSPYDRSVIRPRALVPALNVVSGEALQALVEEFPELNEFIARLQALRRSPVDAAALEGMRDELALARDVGLLEVYEETDQEVRRYRVPDLYRVALGMTRMGPG